VKLAKCPLCGRTPVTDTYCGCVRCPSCKLTVTKYQGAQEIDENAKWNRLARFVRKGREMLAVEREHRKSDHEQSLDELKKAVRGA